MRRLKFPIVFVNKLFMLATAYYSAFKFLNMIRLKTRFTGLNVLTSGSKTRMFPLAPRMAVAAEIKTGERRVIEFFISPFIKYVDESLTLR